MFTTEFHRPGSGQAHRLETSPMSRDFQESRAAKAGAGKAGWKLEDGCGKGGGGRGWVTFFPDAHSKNQVWKPEDSKPKS